MAFIGSTPTEDVNAVLQQTAENTKTAMIWMSVIVVIVLLIAFAGRK